MNRNDADEMQNLRNTLQQCADMLGVSPEQLPEELGKTKEKADEMDGFFALMVHAGKQLKSGDPVNLESFFANRTISAMAALMFAAEFVRGGGRNFFTFDYNVPEFGRINVTIQKPDHKTPAQRIAELVDEQSVWYAYNQLLDESYSATSAQEAICIAAVVTELGVNVDVPAELLKGK